MGKVGRLRKMWHLPTPGATAALSAPQRPETTRLFAGGSGSSWPVPESCEDDFDCNDGSLVFLKWKWCMGVSKNRGTPKWMVKIMENPIIMDDLGVPLFSETSV